MAESGPGVAYRGSQAPPAAMGLFRPDDPGHQVLVSPRRRRRQISGRRSLGPAVPARPVYERAVPVGCLLRFFTAAAPAVMLPVRDPAGYCGEIQPDLDRAKVSGLLREAADIAADAVAWEQQDKHHKAICCWRMIFGPEFPVPPGGCPGLADGSRRGRPGPVRTRRRRLGAPGPWRKARGQRGRSLRRRSLWWQRPPSGGEGQPLTAVPATIGRRRFRRGRENLAEMERLRHARSAMRRKDRDERRSARCRQYLGGRKTRAGWRASRPPCTRSPPTSSGATRTRGGGSDTPLFGLSVGGSHREWLHSSVIGHSR